MPAGIMIPARNMPSMIGRNGSVGGFGLSSGLSLGQVSVQPSSFNVFDNLFFFFFQSLEFSPIFCHNLVLILMSIDWCVGFVQIDFILQKGPCFFTSQNWSQCEAKPAQTLSSILLVIRKTRYSFSLCEATCSLSPKNYQPSQNPRVFCITLISNNLNYPIN